MDSVTNILKMRIFFKTFILYSEKNKNKKEDFHIKIPWPAFLHSHTQLAVYSAIWAPLDEIYSLSTCGELSLVRDLPGLYWRRMNLHIWLKVSGSAHAPLPCVKMERHAAVGHGPRATKERSGMFSSPSVTGTLLAHQSLKTTRGESLPYSLTAAITMAVCAP